LTKLLSDDVGKRSQLSLLRAGKAMKIAFPAAKELAVDTPKAVAKPLGPPTVSVQAEPMADGVLKVTIFYYIEDSSKRQTVTCTGTIPQIEKQVRKDARSNRMSDEVLDLVDTALTRLRELQSTISPK
jgi:hypothetical protein